MDRTSSIEIKGARINNLKNIDVSIPRNRFIVITGLSGSGKSSLAFDTLYAEGQRRYVESLSAYARQFLGRMSKPECDYIKGIPPAIAIEQKVNTRNPRSTVGTSTEIYEYIRLLFSRIGKTISPVTGKEVKKHSPEDVLEYICSYPENTRIMLLTDIQVRSGRTIQQQLEILSKEGYSRIEADGDLLRIDEAIASPALIKGKKILLLVDRFSVSDNKDFFSRATESIETAFLEGGGIAIVKVYLQNEIITQEFSTRFEADGIHFEEPSDSMFNFNNPIGACPKCEGFGKVLGIDENLVVPNKSLSVYDDAIVCWKGEKMQEFKHFFIEHSAAYNFPIHRPYKDLSKEEKDLLWKGRPGLYGINDFFSFLEENLYKIQNRVMLARYKGKTICPECEGSRLKKEALYVHVGGKNIAELVTMPITELQYFFRTLQLDEHEQKIAKRLLVEINNRIDFLFNVGLGYLTLDRLSSTLSGGESQRINLATSLGSALVGSLYILDEPSIGLHSKDTELLIKVLRQLQALGNTVVVVEHDEDIIRSADYVIDIGPLAGRQGGEVVYQGELKNIFKAKSLTADYLSGREQIEVPLVRRQWNQFIEIKGARLHNLKNINVRFPLFAMTSVTGVSGSGKSTLVKELFYEGLRKKMDGATMQSLQMDALEGDYDLIKAVEYVDQNPIGKSSRSNPVTYVKAYDEIRKLFADQPLAKQLGFTPAFFSFNVDGGRCEECKGEGSILVEMQFMADLRLTCEACNGKRFKKEILEILYRGKNIYDILELSIDEAIAFFSEVKGGQEEHIVKKLRPLQEVGLGYVKLGQSSSSLSGGENQRVKLAYYLGEEKQESTLFIFDEPTTGLHFHDIKTLLKAFDALLSRGHTIVVIEHNLDVIKCSDYVIDMGPEGGEKGGSIVCTGTPEDVSLCPASYTGRFLKSKL